MNGFLGTKAGLFVDLFLVILVAMLPVLLWALVLVRRGRIKAHAKIMTWCFVTFVVAVLAFELQVRFGEPGPPLDLLAAIVHLTFAIPATGLWAFQILRGKRVFDERRAHVIRGRILIALLCLTIGTGAWLYAATFI